MCSGLSRRTPTAPQRNDASAIAAITWESRMGEPWGACTETISPRSSRSVVGDHLRLWRPSEGCHHRSPAIAAAIEACSSGGALNSCESSAGSPIEVVGSSRAAHLRRVIDAVHGSTARIDQADRVQAQPPQPNRQTRTQAESPHRTDEPTGCVKAAIDWIIGRMGGLHLVGQKGLTLA